MDQEAFSRFRSSSVNDDNESDAQIPMPWSMENTLAQQIEDSEEEDLEVR